MYIVRPCFNVIQYLNARKERNSTEVYYQRGRESKTLMIPATPKPLHTHVICLCILFLQLQSFFLFPPCTTQWRYYNPAKVYLPDWVNMIYRDEKGNLYIKEKVYGDISNTISQAVRCCSPSCNTVIVLRLKSKKNEEGVDGMKAKKETLLFTHQIICQFQSCVCKVNVPEMNSWIKVIKYDFKKMSGSHHTCINPSL